MEDTYKQGYYAGIAEVLDALVTFCGQGGIIGASNVEAWASTYDVGEA
jgi:hypothetical protein